MIELTDEMRLHVGNALAEGAPVLVATIDVSGQPSLSYYGSTHVHSKDQLAIWMRNPDSAMADRLAANSKIALMYRNLVERFGWQFHGRARIIEDGPEARRAYDESPQAERDRDPDREGHAIIIDVDRVLAHGGILMER